MVLIYDRHSDDPRISQLTDEAYWAWIFGVTTAHSHGRDTITIDEYTANWAKAGHPVANLVELLRDLQFADLVSLPPNKITFRALDDLWAFEPEPQEDG